MPLGNKRVTKMHQKWAKQRKTKGAIFISDLSQVADCHCIYLPFVFL